MACVAKAPDRAYLHFGSKFPFPLNPVFFGQTFVMADLTAAARVAEPSAKNFVFIKKGPYDETLMGSKAQELARGRFNAELVSGYGSDS
ncbi:hypothetical protein HZC07_04630, partial [Candidatus Micrarchaeota archaeon]|nr:hypothetical protein [Candidatus Micrarchaeota archaeon]